MFDYDSVLIDSMQDAFSLFNKYNTDITDPGEAKLIINRIMKIKKLDDRIVCEICKEIEKRGMRK